MGYLISGRSMRLLKVMVMAICALAHLLGRYVKFGFISMHITLVGDGTRASELCKSCFKEPLPSRTSTPPLPPPPPPPEDDENESVYRPTVEKFPPPPPTSLPSIDEENAMGVPTVTGLQARIMHAVLGSRHRARAERRKDGL